MSFSKVTINTAIRIIDYCLMVGKIPTCKELNRNQHKMYYRGISYQSIKEIRAFLIYYNGKLNLPIDDEQTVLGEFENE